MAKTYAVVGLGFGDEGKGSWVDHLVRKHNIRYTLRFNGGAQALHHVHSPEGEIHGFSQFGSGTFVPNVKTILSHFMLIEPLSLLSEAEILQQKGIENPLSRIIISENAPIITLGHIGLNTVRETLRGDSRHGSCGLGIGETQKDLDTQPEKSIYMKDLYGQDDILFQKLNFLINEKIKQARNISGTKKVPWKSSFGDFSPYQNNEEYIRSYMGVLKSFADQVNTVRDSYIQKLISENDMVFEGAQGVLLDREHGFFPYCTRSYTTFKNVYSLLEGLNNKLIKVGLLRAYGTRHGAGPFLSEDFQSQISSCDNTFGKWQKEFRQGWFDSVSARYALNVVDGVNVLAITNIDRLYNKAPLKIASKYKQDSYFFPNGEIRKLNKTNTKILKSRTNEMDNIELEYTKSLVFSSLKDPNCMKYIHTISHLLNKKVDVISVSPYNEKIYL